MAGEAGPILVLFTELDKEEMMDSKKSQLGNVLQILKKIQFIIITVNCMGGDFLKIRKEGTQISKLLSG